MPFIPAAPGWRFPQQAAALAFASLLAFHGIAVPCAFAQVPPTEESVAPVAAELPVTNEEFNLRRERATKGASPYDLGRSVREGFSNLFDEQNTWTLGVGLAGVLAGESSLDSRAQEHFKGNERQGPDLDALGNDVLGTGIPGSLLGISMWVAGDIFDLPYTSHFGQASLEALAATGIVTAVMKGGFQRQRPDGSNYHSFPSGHTSTVFASAMVLQEFYGWKAGVPGFLLGTITAVARMSDNKHWLSDTIAGATIGILFGHAFSKPHLDRFKSYDEKKEEAVSIFPVIEPGGGQLVLRIKI